MKHFYRLHYAFALLMLVVTPWASSAAQSAVSQVSGTVKDATGAIVPGAEVTITNTNTNDARTTQSLGNGTYAFPSLPVGSYQLTVKMTGFDTYVQNGIVLEINSNPEINISLKIGSVAQEVTVTQNASMVESHDTSVTQVINPVEVVDLPLNGRQPTDLIALSGGAINATSAGGMINTLDYPSAVAYSVAGSMPNATNYYLDGIQNMDYRTDVGLPMPFPDALAEFSLGISAMPANLGAHPGGAVNGVTKSGTNSFHGGGFEFVRNGVLDATARTYPNTTGVESVGVRDTLVRNQFGGEVGGPIKKDKVFFFGGYQGTYANSTAGSSTQVVPTTAMLAGNFQADLNPVNGCTGAGTFINDTFTGGGANHDDNIILPQFLNTPSALIMDKVFALLPTVGIISPTVPTGITPCGTIAYQGPPTITSENQGVGRVDWQRTANDSIFGRYYLTHYIQQSVYTPGNLLSSSGTGQAQLVQTVAIGDTYIVGVHGVNTFRLAFDRTATVRTSNPGIPTDCSLGMNATCLVPNSINLYVSKPGSLGYDYENSYGVSEEFAWTNGKHQINAGFTFENVQMNNDGLFQENPGPSFSSATTGVTLADVITGNADGYAQGNGQLGRDAQKQPAAYIQDAWKITPRLQLTGGIRWDPYIAQHNKYAEDTDWTLAGFLAGTQSTVYPNSIPGQTFPGDAGFNNHSDVINHYWLFAPRVGFVWDVNGDGKSTFKAGYGLFYDSNILWNTMHIVLDPPWGETLNFTPLSVAAGGGVANPWFGQPIPVGLTQANPFPFPLNPVSSFPAPAGGTYIFQNQQNKDTNVQQWNLVYQRQMGANLKLSATYIGNKTTHQWLGQSQNQDQYLSAYPYTGNGTGASCNITFGSNVFTFPVCNSPMSNVETVKVNGVSLTNTNARRALGLLEPAVAPLLTGGLTVSSSGYNAAYNGLIVSAQQRLSHGFSLLTNLTWSRSMDLGEGGQDIGNNFSIPDYPKFDWGPSSYNQKLGFNLSLTAESPRFENRALRDVASNWNGSVIYTAHTGSNFNVGDGYDFSLTANSNPNGVTTTAGSDRPNEVGNWRHAGPVAANPNCTLNPALTGPGGAPAAVHTTRFWFNPCAFVPAAFGAYGAERRNDLVGPGNWNANLAVWRSFPLPEHIKMDFRAEGFNALNHTEIGNPGASLFTSSGNSYIPNTSVGFISSSNAQGPRIVQLSAKFEF